ncbi:MAG: hypothetical protein QME59_07120 [Candidatus Hydrothermarchaeota archaeon]|nr:hypothetical protein [Candidatus Hydrothermarchaeota archaeon]
MSGIENCSFYEQGNFRGERDKLLREFEREAIGIVRSLPEGNAKKRIESLVDEYAEKWY